MVIEARIWHGGLTMDDTFLEKIVKKRRTGKDFLKIFGIIFAGVILLFLFMAFSQIIGFLMPILIVAIVYGLYFFISNTNREYEYIVTNGEIDIDVIIARRRRKRVFNGRVRDFEIMAKTDSDDFREAQKGNYALADYSSSPVASDSWFFLTEYKGQRTMVIFQPDDRMLASMKKFNPSKVKFNRFSA